MSRPMRELQVLAEFFRDASVEGDQAAGTWWRPTPASGGGELDSPEVAEVVAVVVVPPVTSAGVEEDLRVILLNLDGKVDIYNRIPGTNTYLVHAPREKLLYGRITAFGKPLWNVQPGFTGVLQATCPKYRDSITVEAYAGGAITSNYRIRILGYRYRAEDLAAAVANLGGTLGGSDSIVDPATGRKSAVINKPAVAISEDTWTQLPGGLDQAIPKVFHFIRMAFNARATTPNLPYEFRFKDGFVATREEDMLFEYDIEKKVAVIRGLGVRGPSNLKEIWVDVGGDERPKSRWPVYPPGLNPLHFGKGYPVYPSDFPIYFTIPLLDDPVLVADEKAVIKVVDNGTQIAVNQIAVIINGVMVELT